MKKILSLFFLFVFLCSVFLTSCKETEESIFTFNVDGEFVEITGLTEHGKTLSKIAIPNEIDGKKVTSIKEYAFYDCDNIESIELNVGRINENAFANCDNLKKIKLSADINSKIIHPTAFLDTYFYNDSKNWENDVLYIGNVLYKAKTAVNGDYVVKSGTDSISDLAFLDCDKITSITIPSSVYHIGTAFQGCKNLSNIFVSENNAGSYYDIDGNLLLNAYGGIFCYYCPSKTNETFVVPSANVGYISSYAFEQSSNLKKVVISNGITYIGHEAFRLCNNLNEIVIPNTVTEIEYTAFLYCNNLTKINFLGTQEEWGLIENISDLILNSNTIINYEQ